MAKANVTLPSGATVSVEGTADEVATLVQRLAGEGNKPQGRGAKSAGGAPAGPKARRRGKSPTEYVRELISEGFFDEKRELSDVKQKLEASAHIYPIGTLSPALFRLVKGKELRRIKEGGSWKYVNA